LRQDSWNARERHFAWLHHRALNLYTKLTEPNVRGFVVNPHDAMKAKSRWNAEAENSTFKVVSRVTLASDLAEKALPLSALQRVLGGGCSCVKAMKMSLEGGLQSRGQAKHREYNIRDIDIVCTLTSLKAPLNYSCVIHTKKGYPIEL